MADIKGLLLELSQMMTVSGHEYRSAEQLKQLVLPYFHEYNTDPAGNHVFIKRCGKEQAPRLLIDAHYDEIGMIVTQIKDDGFVKVLNIGGLDTRIMLAGEVTLYADEPVYGVVCATPPHLQKPGESKKLPAVTDLIIDTGFTKEALEAKGVRIGTPVGFRPTFTDLLNGKVASKGFDNKACVAAAIAAVERLSDDIEWDIYLLLSCKEEIGMLGGRTGAFSIQPDAAIVLDVNLAFVPDTKRHQTVKLDEGAAVSISAVTDRRLTKALLQFAREREIKHQTVVETTGTGTNANLIPLVREGIPTAVISVPLKNMHTYSEVISIADVEATAELLAEFIKGGLSAWRRD